MTNALIGEAIASKVIKKYWLDNSDNYKVKINGEDGYIKVQFKTPIDTEYRFFSMIGQKNNLDDVVKFTYEFLNYIGVYYQFKNNGHAAIELINKTYLAYH